VDVHESMVDDALLAALLERLARLPRSGGLLLATGCFSLGHVFSIVILES
jgi:hypothetical protein